ncbi:hypothetical protein, partial [Burkholderia vietnamiensis]
PAYAAALASQQRGAGYISEQQDLKATGLFVYSLSDVLNDPLNAMGDWALQQAKSAGRGAANLGNALLKKIAQNGPQGPYVNPDDLNGPSGGGNGTPPTATAVVTPIPCPAGPGACGMAITPVVTPGAPTMSAGGGDGQPSVNDSTGDLASAANQPFKDGQAITNAGRSVTKHPEYFGFDSTQDLRQVYRSDAQLNELAANAVQDILQNGTKTTGAGGRYPNGWVTYTLPDGRAASWTTSGEFIGFRGLQK